MEWRQLDCGSGRRGCIVGLHCGQELHPGQRPASSLGFAHRHHPTAAQGSGEVVVAQHDAVADLRVQRSGRCQVHAGRVAARCRRFVDEQDACLGVAAGVVDVCRVVVLHGAGEVGEHREFDADALCRLAACRRHQPVAAGYLLCADAGEVDRGAVAGRCRFGVLVLHPHAANANSGAGIGEHETVVGAGGSGQHGAGDDRAAAAHGEGAVDGEAERFVCAGGAVGAGRQGNVATDFVHAGSRGAGDGQCGGLVQEGSCGERAHVAAHFLHAGRRHAVDLVEHDDPARKAEQREDLQVFAGLRHHAVVHGDDQHGELARGDAGDHVVDEAVVAGDVHEADAGGIRVAQVCVGEA